MISQFLGPTHSAFLQPLPLAEVSGGELIKFHELSSLAMTLGVVAVGGVITVMGIRNQLQREKLRHETIRVALEKGQALPPDLHLLDARRPPRPSRPNADRRAGLVLVAFGASLFIVLRVLKSGFPQVSWLGLIPGLVGAALLLNWFLDQRGRPGADQP